MPQRIKPVTQPEIDDLMSVLDDTIVRLIDLYKRAEHNGLMTAGSLDDALALMRLGHASCDLAYAITIGNKYREMRDKLEYGMSLLKES